MQIHIINPNTSEPMSQKIREAAISTSEVAEIVMHTNPHGAPSLESHFEEALATPGILQIVDEISKEKQADALLIACFGDPAIHAIREMVNIPVVGIAEAAMRTAAMLGDSFSIVTTLARTLPMAHRILWETGLEARCMSATACDLEVQQLEGNDTSAYEQLRDECYRVLAEHHADSIVLGCAGMADLTERLSADLNIPVIDGVAAGVKLLESLGELGLKPSKTGDRAYPPVKTIKGPYAHLARQ